LIVRWGPEVMGAWSVPVEGGLEQHPDPVVVVVAEVAVGSIDSFDLGR
jgi:hypothetical protein